MPLATCACVHAHACLHASLLPCLPAYLCACLPACLPNCLPAHLSACLHACLHVGPYAYLFAPRPSTEITSASFPQATRVSVSCHASTMAQRVLAHWIPRPDMQGTARTMRTQRCGLLAARVRRPCLRIASRIVCCMVWMTTLTSRTSHTAIPSGWQKTVRSCYQSPPARLIPHLPRLQNNRQYRL